MVRLHFQKHFLLQPAVLHGAGSLHAHRPQLGRQRFPAHAHHQSVLPAQPQADGGRGGVGAGGPAGLDADVPVEQQGELQGELSRPQLSEHDVERNESFSQSAHRSVPASSFHHQQIATGESSVVGLLRVGRAAVRL